MRLHVRVGWLVAIVFLLTLIRSLIACNSFNAAPTNADASASSNDGGTCTTDTCDDAGVSCRAYNFSGSTCPPADWSFEGQDPPPDAIKECKDGAIHVAAKNTLDAMARLLRKTPGQLSTVHVSLRFALANWDGLNVFEIGVGDTSGFTITALETARGEMDLKLCAPETNCVPLATVPFNTEHILVMELGPTGISAAVNCGPWATRPGQPPAPNARLGLDFGHAEGNPMDGTIRDVVVSFR